MKVLFLTNHLRGGDGWSQYSLNIIKPLKQSGVAVSCLVECEQADAQIMQFPVLRRPLWYVGRFGPVFVASDLYSVWRLARQEKPDIIHCLVEPYLYFLPLLRLAGVRAKLVSTVHGTYAVAPFRGFWSARFTRWCFKQMNQVIAASEYTAERLLEFCPFLKNRLSVISGGVAGVMDALTLQRVIRPVGGPLNIIFIGAIKERKGLVEAVQALAEFSRRFHQPFVYTMVGPYNPDSAYVKKIKELIARHQLSEYVKFTGPVSEIEKQQRLRSADVLLMLAKSSGDNFEGFGLVYLEANTLGIPVLGPRDGGPREAIKDGFSGFTADRDNPIEVAEKLEKIRRGKILPAHCRAWAQANAAEKKAEQVWSVYQKLLQ